MFINDSSEVRKKLQEYQAYNFQPHLHLPKPILIDGEEWDFRIIMQGKSGEWSSDLEIATMSLNRSGLLWRILVSFYNNHQILRKTMLCDFDDEGRFSYFESKTVSNSSTELTQVTLLPLNKLCVKKYSNEKNVACKDIIFDNNWNIQFHPLWLFCSAFMKWNVPSSGKLAILNIVNPFMYCNWVNIIPLNASVVDDTIDIVKKTATKVWRITGDEPDGKQQFKAYIGKNQEGLLRLDLNDSSSAIMFARAGR